MRKMFSFFNPTFKGFEKPKKKKQSTKKVLYFAYGSNLLIERLQHRVGDIKVHNTFIMKDYELVFSKTGFADVIPKKGEVVEGVLYEMYEYQIELLDFYERFYTRELIGEDNTLPIFVYIGIPRERLQRNAFYFERPKPSLDYLNIIIEGAINFKLKNTAKKLIAYKKENFKLKKAKKYNLD